MRINEHSLESLRKVVRDLQQENQALKAILDENSIPYESRNVLEDQFLPDEYDEDQGARILPYYPNEDMAREFYSYFWGRMDVFAKRGRKGGYFPQCAARWNNSLCPKARDEKAICDEDCQYKSWKPLELWMIVQHLRGAKEDCTDVIGVYPLFPNNTCRFLVFDFDNHEKDSYKNDDANENDLWKSEVDALRRICEINGIDALTERSRSGRGAHIWIFFKSAIPAILARAFGYALLDRGASSINLPSFKYYDRMYPSQDVLNKLGNLVALPLQGQALMQRIWAKYIYGLSATPNRSDRLDDIIYMLLGSVRHKYTAKEQADEQGLDRFVVPRFTRVANITGEKLDIHQADSLIAESAVRNEQIVEDICQAIANGRTPVVLTKLRRHAETLTKMLADKADHVFLVYGGQPEKQNQLILKEMLSVPDSETLVLIATGQKIGEGFNFPRLDTLMLASPIKFEGRLIQYVGRLNRTYKNKREVMVFDYVDPHIRFFDRQYRSRLAAYKKLGYKVISAPVHGGVSEREEQINVIYDRRDYTEVFERDLIEANVEIVIASPGLTRRKAERLMELVKARQEAGVSVTVITLDPDAEGYENTIERHILIDEMKNNGVYVRTTEDESEHYAVIDHEIVWHGGINLLGKEDAWDNLIRVINRQAAAELLEISCNVL